MSNRIHTDRQTRHPKLLTPALLALSLSGCLNLQQVPPAAEHRGTDEAPPLIPWEPRTQAGNTSPYTVAGQRYHILADSRHFKQTGIASWYGHPFHGKPTANGERYDMHEMSAAHKTLPIPSYVRVTHLGNGRQITVRINDRGPFHGDRVIDLSFAAASALDMVDQGTAKVSIEAIEPLPPRDRDQLPYVQVGAFSAERTARALQRRVESWIDEHPVRVMSDNSRQMAPTPLFKVWIGPLASFRETRQVLTALRAKAMTAHVVFKGGDRRRHTSQHTELKHTADEPIEAGGEQR